MELIMISSSKLKIMLSADDMTKYALGSDIDYSDQKTRQAFRAILNEAREKTGFDAESEKIFIQLYPSKKGGCEVYITKIDDESEHICEIPQKPSEPKGLCKNLERCAGIIPPSKRHAAKERKRAYSFSSLDILISVCRRLISVDWHGQSSAFCDENKIFYIILKEKFASEHIHPDKISFICEYGENENHNSILKYLSEHGKCFCKSGAVEKLGIL